MLSQEQNTGDTYGRSRAQIRPCSRNRRRRRLAPSGRTAPKSILKRESAGGVTSHTHGREKCAWKPLAKDAFSRNVVGKRSTIAPRYRYRWNGVVERRRSGLTYYSEKIIIVVSFLEQNGYVTMEIRNSVSYRAPVYQGNSFVHETVASTYVRKRIFTEYFISYYER